MCSAKPLTQTRRTARAGLVAAIFSFIIGLGAAWPQETPQPRLDEEFTKQESIYHSRDDVPDGYVTARGLSDYVALLPPGFCHSLARLGSSDRWLDVGAGAGYAILDYHNLQRCAASSVRARAVAMSIEDRRTGDWHQLAASLGEGRLKYLAGKRLRHYSLAELGKFQLITDVYGGFSYSEDLSRFVETVLGLLETGGVFYTLVQSVRLDDGKDSPDTVYLTEILDSAGKDMKVCPWLKRISCVQVSCASKTEWSPTELVHVRKTCRDVSVPRLKLLTFEAGNPPGRRFQLSE